MIRNFEYPEEARLQTAYDNACARVQQWITGERRLLLQGTCVEYLTEEGLMEFIAADEDKPRDFADADRALGELRAYRETKRDERHAESNRD